MRIMKILKYCCFVLMFIMLKCTSVAAASDDLGDQSENRSIAIIFDNSDSMVRNSGDKDEKSKYLKRWAQATYALRTFMHMVNDSDTVRLYTVDKKENDATTGTYVTKKNIDDVIKTMGVSCVTKMFGMEAAYNWIEKENNKEKWVVILTDGKFYGNKKHDGELSANKSIGYYIKKNKSVKTICIGLGLSQSARKELKGLKKRYKKNCEVYCTSGSKKSSVKDNKKINNTILKISKKIYTMEKLSNKKIRANSNLKKNNYEFFIDKNGTLTWETKPGLSDYLKEIIIMAQVEGIVNDDSVDKEMGPQVIHSDKEFAWGGIKRHNTEAQKEHGKGYGFLISEEDNVIKKIKSTCYIQRYGGNSGNEIGDKVQFELPKGGNQNRYTYQIYYILSAEFVPAIKSEKTEYTAEDNNSSVLEAKYKVSYNAMSGKEKLPKSLLGIRTVKKTIKIKIDKILQKQNNNINKKYDYIDSKNKKRNRHTVSASYKGKRRNFAFTIIPDLTKYKLSFWNEEQFINIDIPNKNKLLLKLPDTLYYWIKNKKKEKESEFINYSFSDKNGNEVSTLGIRLEKANITKEDGFVKIGIPIKINDPNNVEMEKTYDTLVSIPAEEGTELIAENGEVSITQNPPEIILNQTDAVSIYKVHNNSNLTMTAFVKNKKVDVEFLEENFKLDIDDKIKNFSFALKTQKDNSYKIICSLNTNILKYIDLVSKNAHIRGTIKCKRNGLPYELPAEVDFQWKLNIWPLLISSVILIILLIIVFIIGITVKKKCFLFDELCCNNYKGDNFFIRWEDFDGSSSPINSEQNGHNGIHKGPFKMKVALKFNNIMMDYLKDKYFIFVGTKEGYYLKNKKDFENIKEVEVIGSSLANKNDYISIKIAQKEKLDEKIEQKQDPVFKIIYVKDRQYRKGGIFLIAIIIILVILAGLFISWFFFS